MNIQPISWVEQERQVAFFETISPTRITPSAMVSDFMGELRSLVHSPWTGAEIWEDWRYLFEAQDEETQHAAFEYLGHHWQWRAIDDLSEMGIAFDFQAMTASKRTLQDHALWFASPPAALDDVRKWEAKHGVLPYPLLRFLTELTAGDPHADEQMYFFFDWHQSSETYNMFLTFTDMVDEALFEEDGEVADYAEHVARALEQQQHSWSVKTLQEHPAAALETRLAVQQSVLVSSYFEGNHGDDSTFVIREGAFAEHVVTYDSLLHSGLDAGHIIHHTTEHPNGEHTIETIGRWLVALFYRHYACKEIE